MSYRIIDYASQYRGSTTRIDPRAALARHMGWQTPTNMITASEFNSPEPPNYNYAVRGPRAQICDLSSHTVFYREDSLWWSLYIVSGQKHQEMLAWADNLDIDIFWFNSKLPRRRSGRGLLFNTKCADINTEERLFQMGYYSKLQSKYFSDDDRKLLSLLGPVRDRVLEGLGLEDTGKFDEAES